MLQSSGIRWPVTEYRLYGGQLCHRLAIPHSAAMEAWHALRGLVGQTGHWPVISRPNVDNDLDFSYPSELPTAQLLARSEALDLDAWIAERNDPADFEDFDRYARGTWPDWLDPDDLEGYDPEDFIDLDDMFVTPERPPVEIVLLPVRESWMVFTLMAPTGGDSQRYNSDELHVAIHKRWHERYGAELVAMTQDALELFVPRPPQDPGAAMQVAWEHFAYCNDAVYQSFPNVSTVSELAARYLRRRAWHFWWD
jgi:hypothetical protein